MALYIPHSIFHLARLLYVRPETFGPYYVYLDELCIVTRLRAERLRNKADLYDLLVLRYVS